MSSPTFMDWIHHDWNDALSPALCHPPRPLPAATPREFVHVLLETIQQAVSVSMAADWCPYGRCWRLTSSINITISYSGHAVSLRLFHFNFFNFPTRAFGKDENFIFPKRRPTWKDTKQGIIIIYAQQYLPNQCRTKRNGPMGLRLRYGRVTPRNEFGHRKVTTSTTNTTAGLLLIDKYFCFEQKNKTRAQSRKKSRRLK